MRTLGPYTAVADDGPTWVGRRWLARPADGDERQQPTFALYDTAGDVPPRPGLRGELLDRIERRQRELALERQYAILKALGDAGAAGWVRPVECGRDDAGRLLAVTAWPSRGLDRLARSHASLPAERLTPLVRQIVRALGESQKHLGRGHGNLAAATIRLTDRGDVLLAEPTPDAAPVSADMRALGAVLYELIVHEPFQPRVSWPIERGPKWRRIGRNGDAWRRLVTLLLDPQTPDEQLTPDAVLAQVPRPPSTRAPRAAGIAAAIVLAIGGFVGSAWVFEGHPLRPLLVAWSPTEFDPQAWQDLALADEAWLASLYTAHAAGQLDDWPRHGLVAATQALQDIQQQRQAVDPDGKYTFITRAIARSQATPGSLAMSPTESARAPAGYTATYWTWDAAKQLATAIRDAPLRPRINAAAADWSFLDGAGPHGHLQRVAAVLAMPIDDPRTMRDLAAELPPDRAVSAAIAWSEQADALQPLARDLRQALAVDAAANETSLPRRFAAVLRQVLDADAAALGEAYLPTVRERAALALAVAKLVGQHQQRAADDAAQLAALSPEVAAHPVVQQYRQEAAAQQRTLEAAMSTLERNIAYVTSVGRLETELDALRTPLAAALSQPTLADVLQQPPTVPDPRPAVAARLDSLDAQQQQLTAAGRLADQTIAPSLVRLRDAARAAADQPWTLLQQTAIERVVTDVSTEADQLESQMLLDESRWLARSAGENLPILEAAQAPAAPRFREQFAALDGRLSRIADGPGNLPLLRTLRDDLDRLYRDVRPELALGRLAEAVAGEIERAVEQGAALGSASTALRQLQRNLATRDDRRITAEQVRDVRAELDRLLRQALEAQPSAGLPGGSLPSVDVFWRAQRDALLGGDADVATVIAAVRTLRQALADLAARFPAYDPQIPAPPGWQHDAVAGFVNARRDEAIAELLGSASADSLGRPDLPIDPADAEARFTVWRQQLAAAAATLVRIHDHLLRFTGLDRDPPVGDPTTATLVQQVRDVPGFTQLRPMTGPTLAAVEQIEAIATQPIDVLQRLAQSDASPNALRLAAWRQLGRTPTWPGSEEQFENELTTAADLRTRLASAGLDEARRSAIERELTTAATERWQRYATSGDAQRLEAAVQRAPELGVNVAALPAALQFDYQRVALKRALLDLGETADPAPALTAYRAFDRAAPTGEGDALRRRLEQQIAEIQGNVARPRGGPATASIAGVTWTQLPQPDDTVATFRWEGVSQGPHVLRFVRVEDRSRGVPAIMLQDSEFTIGLFLDLLDATQAHGQLRQMLRNPYRQAGPVGWQIIEPAGGQGAGRFEIARSSAPWISSDDQLLSTGRLSVYDDTDAPLPPGPAFPLNHVSPEAAAALAGLIGSRLPTQAEWQTAYRRAAAGWDIANDLAAAPRPNLLDATWTEHYRQLEQKIARLPEADRLGSERLISVLLQQDFTFPWPTGPAGGSDLPAGYDDGILWLTPMTDDRPSAPQHLVGNLAELVFVGEPVTIPPREVLDLPTTGTAALSAVRQRIARTESGRLGVIGGSFASQPRPDAQPLPPLRAAWRPTPEGWGDVGFRLAYPAPDRSLQSQLLAILDTEPYRSIPAR